MSREFMLNVNEYANSSDLYENSNQNKQNISDWSYPNNRSPSDFDQWSTVPSGQNRSRKQTPVIEINTTTQNKSNLNQAKPVVCDWSYPDNGSQNDSDQWSTVPDQKKRLQKQTPVVEINTITKNKSNLNQAKPVECDWSVPDNGSQNDSDQWSTVSHRKKRLQKQTPVVEINTIPNNNSSSNQTQRNISDWSYPDHTSQNDFDQWPMTPSPNNTLQQQMSVRELSKITNNSSNIDQNYGQSMTFSLQTELTNNSISEEEEKQRRPWFIWIMSIIQVCVFIVELIYSSLLTTRPIETNISLNPLFGPNPYVLINIGASFSPCMHAIDGITNNVSATNFPCPNSPTLTNTGCTLSELCGFNGVSNTPNQWYRFIISIFLHVGIVHILFNLITQLLIAGEIEKKIGVIRIAFIYFASGIFGFILGGNFAPDGLCRVGCSGSLFAIIALSLLDLLYNWKKTENPKIQLTIHIVNIIINFVLGLLPGVDNFSHIGGFVIGLLLGLAILGSPGNLRR
ncbi:unnamed protein product, partial [Rotaria sp. Silwood1]